MLYKLFVIQRNRFYGCLNSHSHTPHPKSHLRMNHRKMKMKTIQAINSHFKSHAQLLNQIRMSHHHNSHLYFQQIKHYNSWDYDACMDTLSKTMENKMTKERKKIILKIRTVWVKILSSFVVLFGKEKKATYKLSTINMLHKCFSFFPFNLAHIIHKTLYGWVWVVYMLFHISGSRKLLLQSF